MASSGEAIDALEEGRKTINPVLDLPKDRVVRRSIYVDIQITDASRVGALRLRGDLDDPASMNELRARLTSILDDATGG